MRRPPSTETRPTRSMTLASKIASVALWTFVVSCVLFLTGRVLVGGWLESAGPVVQVPYAVGGWALAVWTGVILSRTKARDR